MKSIKYIALLLLAAYGPLDPERCASHSNGPSRRGLRCIRTSHGDLRKRHLKATGTGSCIVAFTGGGGTGREGDRVTVTSNTP